MRYPVLKDYREFEQKVRAIMYCLNWGLLPERDYYLFKFNDFESWFTNCPDDKEKYYKNAQKYLRRDKILRIKRRLY